MMQIVVYLFKQDLLKSFNDLGYSQLDHLYPNQIEGVLKELNEQQFDPEYFEEIIDQCKTTSKGQIKIQDLIDVFIKAQLILVQRDSQIKNKIFKNKALISQKSNKNDQQDNIEKVKLQQQVQQLVQQLSNNNAGIQVLRKPFKKNLRTQTKSPNVNKSNYNNGRSNNQPLSMNIPQGAYYNYAFDSDKNNSLFQQKHQAYTYILQLSIILIILSLPSLLFHNGFMNILLLGLIILNMISGYFCKYILRIWMYLLTASILIDIAWYLIGARYLWNHNFDDWPHKLNLFLKLSVVLNGVITFGKIILAILLVTEYNTDENQRKKVSLFGLLQFDLSHDQKQRNLFPCLNRPKRRNNNQL